MAEETLDLGALLSGFEDWAFSALAEDNFGAMFLWKIFNDYFSLNYFITLEIHRKFYK